jgi:hypothetical protein
MSNPSKGKIWRNISKQIDRLDDRLGMKIDPNIKGVVIGFNANRLPTKMSCGGHITKDRERAFPWVYFEAPNEPKYRFGGDKKLMNRLAKKYQIKSSDIFYQVNKLAAKEYWVAVLKKKIPETKNYIHWTQKNKRLEHKVKSCLKAFYAQRKDKPEVRIELGPISPGSRIEVLDKYANKWKKNLSEKDFKSKIKESQKEMSLLADFLKVRFFAGR